MPIIQTKTTVDTFRDFGRYKANLIGTVLRKVEIFEDSSEVKVILRNGMWTKFNLLTNIDYIAIEFYDQNKIHKINTKFNDISEFLESINIEVNTGVKAKDPFDILEVRVFCSIVKLLEFGQSLASFNEMLENYPYKIQKHEYPAFIKNFVSNNIKKQETYWKYLNQTRALEEQLVNKKLTFTELKSELKSYYKAAYLAMSAYLEWWK